MGVRVKDRGAAKLTKDLKRFQKTQPVVRVGVLGSKAAEDHGGVTTAFIAAAHELGAGVPRRSWLVDGINENRARIRKMWDYALGAAPKGPVILRRQLAVFGALVVGVLQERIAAGILPPLDPRTIRRKGSSVPLIDTGQLRTAITHEVEDI